MLSVLSLGRRRLKRSPRVGSVLHRLTVFAMIVLVAAEPVAAQTLPIVADPGRPAAAPRVYSAGNGVPAVDIAAPNSAGLSDNRYLEFSTGPDGAILNNSIAPLAASKLGGLLPGNGNLAGTGPARVILNEVTGSGRSTFAGRLEVFGTAAELVLANPNGITCNGCGFVNTPRVTLSTGMPEFGSDGSLSALSVSGGDVTIGSKGADLSARQVFDIVSRQIHVLGPVAGPQTGNLDLIAGHNRYAYASGAVLPLGADGKAPAVAIDSSVLGGMYSGRIALISTDRGSGVNMRAGMASNAGQMTLTADGRLVLRGAHATGGRITARSKSSSVDVGGTVYSDAGVTLSGHGGVRLDAGAVIAAAGDVALAGRRVTLAGGASAAAGLAADVSETTRGGVLSVAVSADVANHGTLWGTSGVAFALDCTLANSGSIVSNGVFALAGSAAARAGTVRNEAGATIDAASAELNAASLVNGGSFTAHGGDLAADLSGTLVNSGTLSATGDAALTVAGAVSNAGTLAANGTLRLAGANGHATGAVVNGASAVVNGNAGLDLVAASLDNAGQTGSGRGSVTARLSDGLANSGLLYAATSASYTVGAGLTNSGTIAAGGGTPDLVLAGDLTNSGTLSAASDLTLALVGDLANSGSILSNGAFGLAGLTTARARAVNNAPGATINVASADLTAVSLVNDGRFAAHGGTLAADLSGGLANSGTLSAAGDAALTVAGAVANTGTLAANGDAAVEAGQGIDNSGTLSAGGRLALQTSGSGAVRNAAGGIIDGEAGLDLAAASLENAGQAGSAQGSVAAGLSGDLANSGLLYAGTSAVYRLDGTFTNTAADVIAGTDLAIAGLSGPAATALLNSSGRIEAVAGDLAVDAGSLTNRRTAFTVTSTTTSTQSSQSFPLPSCDPCDGVLRLDITATTTTDAVAADTGPAEILASGDMALTASTIDNAESRIAANGDLTIAAGSLTNEGGDLVRTTVTVTNELDYHIRVHHCIGGWGHCGHKTYFSRAPTRTTTTTIPVGAVFGTITAGGRLTADVTGYLANNAVHGGAAPIGLSAGTPAPAGTAASTAPATASSAGLPAASGQASASAGLDLDIANLAGRTALFDTVPAPDAPYLVETRPAFVDPGKFLGSDYFLNRIGAVDPNVTMKRFGDAYAETRLVESQIYDLTGQRFLDGADNAVAQMKALYDNAVDEQKALGLTVGVALTPDQEAALTSDVIWLERRTVGGQVVLVPHLYLAAATAANTDLLAAQISGGRTRLAAAALTNSGTVSGASDLTLAASGAIGNFGGGLLSGGDLTVSAGGAFTNVSGNVAGAGSVVISAASIANDTANYRNTAASGFTDQAAPTANIAAGGDLLLVSSGAIESTGGRFAAGRTLDMAAGGPIDLSALTPEEKGSVTFAGGHDRRESRSSRLATVSAGGDLNLSSGGELTLAGVDAQAGGAARLAARGDVTIASVEDEKSHDFALSYNSGIGSHATSADSGRTTTVRASRLAAGGGLSIDAGRDVTVQASALSAGTGAAGGGIAIAAGGDITIASGLSTQESQSRSSDHGLLASSAEAVHSYDETTVGSRLSAADGLSLSAGGDVAIAGSGLAAGGALSVTGAGVSVVGAEESHALSESRRKSGLFVGSGGGFVSLYGSKSSDSAQSSTVNVASSLQAGTDAALTAMGTDVDILGSQVAAGRDLTLAARRDVNVTPGAEARTATHETKRSGFGIGVSSSGGGFSVGVGVETATDATRQAANGNALSTLAAGRDLRLAAGRDINLQAAHLAAGGTVALNAVRNANMLSALDSSNYAHIHKTLFAGISLDVQSSLVGAGKGLADAARDLGGPNAAYAVAPTALAALKAGDALAAAGQGLGTAGAEFDRIEAGRSNLASVSLGIGFKAETTTETASATSPAVTTIASGGATAIAAQQGSITGHGVQISAGLGAGGLGAGDVGAGDVGAGGVDAGSPVAGGRPVADAPAGDVLLSAGRSIALSSVQSESRSDERARSVSARVGIGIGTGGGGPKVSAAAADAKAGGTAVAELDAHVAGAGGVRLASGGDTRLKGAVVSGQSVTVDAGGGLSIESRPDTATYGERSIGGSLSLGPGGVPGGVEKGTVAGAYANVGEQSGLVAGAGGYHVTAAGGVDLKGGVIVSTGASTAVKDANSLTADHLTFTDLANRAQAKASSQGIALDSGGLPVPQIGQPAQEQSAGTARATLTPGKLTLAHQSQDLTGLNTDLAGANTQARRYDLARLKAKQANAAALSELLNQGVGDLSARLGLAEGSPAKVALHAAAGALTAVLSDGDSGLAALAGGSQELVGAVVDRALMDNPGLTQAERDALGKWAAVAVGAVTGGETGAAAALDAETYNRQLHIAEEDLIAANAARYAVRRGYCASVASCPRATVEMAVAELTAQAVRQTDATGRDIPENAAAAQFLADIAPKGTIPAICPTGASDCVQTWFHSSGAQYRDATVNVQFINQLRPAYDAASALVDSEHLSQIDIANSLIREAQGITATRQSLSAGSGPSSPGRSSPASSPARASPSPSKPAPPQRAPAASGAKTPVLEI